MRHLACLLVTVCCLASVAQAATYYLSSDGGAETPHDGSDPAHAFSVTEHNAQAADFFKPGDTIYIVGTIEDKELVPPSSGSTAGFITYDGWEGGEYEAITRDGGPLGTLTGSGTDGWKQGTLLKVSSKQYLRFRDLVFRNRYYGLYITKSDHIEVVDCFFLFLGRHGVYTYTATNTNITIGGAPGDGNEFYNISPARSGADIKLVYADTATISFNHLWADGGVDHTWGTQDDRGTQGIEFASVSGLLIENNHIHHHNDDTYENSAGSGRGVGAIRGRNASSLIIRYNFIHDELSHDGNGAINFFGNTSKAYIYGNFVRGARCAVYVDDGNVCKPSNAQCMEGWDEADLINGGTCNDGNHTEDIFIFSNIFSDLERSGVYVNVDACRYSCEGLPTGTSTCPEGSTPRLQGDQIRNLMIHNNVFARAAKVPASTRTAGVYLTRRITGALLHNNIFFDNRPASEDTVQMSISSTSVQLAVGENMFFTPRGPPQVHWHGSAIAADDAQIGANNTIADPLFVDPSPEMADFRLSETSPARDVGASSGFLHADYALALSYSCDFEQVTTSSAAIATVDRDDDGSWDLGAFEHEPPPPPDSGPPDAGSDAAVVTEDAAVAHPDAPVDVDVPPVQTDAIERPDVEAGCGCQQQVGASWPVSLLALALPFLIRRRRRRPRNDLETAGCATATGWRIHRSRKRARNLRSEPPIRQP